MTAALEALEVYPASTGAAAPVAFPADVDDDELAARQADAVAQFVNDDGDAD